jgi:chromosomal replication initiation ATPase DnaA
VVSTVCAHYGITPETAVSAQRNDLRKVVIYLMKKLSAASNQEIGETVGGMSGFAVAKAYQRMKEEMGKDAFLRREVETLAGKLSRVKG